MLDLRFRKKMLHLPVYKEADRKQTGSSKGRQEAERADRKQEVKMVNRKSKMADSRQKGQIKSRR